MLLNSSSSIISNVHLAKHNELVEPLISNHRIINSSRIRCVATTTAVVPPRKSANYQPNLWTFDFLQSLKHDYSDSIYEDLNGNLKEKVRRMIKQKEDNGEIWHKLDLVNDVKRLGLSYHFEKEIEETLDRFASNRAKFVNTNNLHQAALSFSLLREYGYHVSPDVFEKFKDKKNNFKKGLTKDVKGMLSLYEASFLGYEGEIILDEAKSFTTFHLKNSIINDENNVLLEQVKHALELPLHHRIQRLEARWYIEAYEKRRDSNRILLEAAKLDFNVVQSTLQKDLQEISRWWKQVGVASKLSFSRDRLMECFFWTVGMAFEPHFSDLRKGLTKVTSFITIIDDVYDVYGTLDELELFTAAVESWDIKAVQVLPDYMRICFLALFNTVNELAYDVLYKQGLDILPYLTRTWSDMLKAFLIEAKWCKEKNIPKFEEYLNNAWVSVSGVVILTHAYFLLNHNITKEALDSLHNYHGLLRGPSTIFRLCNDLGTSKAELQRGEAASSIICYMRENGASEECAHKYINNVLDETWKKMNKDRVTNSPFSKSFIETAMNLGRISQCTYQYGDAHGAPDASAKNRIRSLIIEPVSL
ncbi:hypothetical protein HN51_035151 [Arachis hypogaea]|uniref:Isoprene synthase n=1 Tax=Arachis hypogaea TaxID=3818 RepID=A0A445A5M6_ARAHY|nr:tricyclene synthase EBOS, chloroplastic [Arachis ipaensis]XP_025643308.1 tricyclene synthase EBOS, chloroplastic [Arachis hypogaea]QHO00138.1 Tricyclene synthase EBOS [Arachis hypogaea]RYR21737.1 hypothetical protein Ahy_B03g067064 [Arachis hypogaea]